MMHLFIDNLHGKFLIKCFPQDQFSKIIWKYRMLSGDYNSSDFLYNGKKVDPNVSILSQGILDGSLINVSSYSVKGGGGFCAKFTDVSQMKTINLEVSNIGPSYRKVDKGINIFGKCNCQSCEAGIYNIQVIVPIESNKFDLINQKDEIFCPQCQSHIKLETVGFYMCKFKIYGKKYEDGLVRNFENPIDESIYPKVIKYFDPDMNNETTFIELIFEVLNYY